MRERAGTSLDARLRWYGGAGGPCDQSVQWSAGAGSPRDRAVRWYAEAGSPPDQAVRRYAGAGSPHDLSARWYAHAVSPHLSAVRWFADADGPRDQAVPRYVDAGSPCDQAVRWYADAGGPLDQAVLWSAPTGSLRVAPLRRSADADGPHDEGVPWYARTGSAPVLTARWSAGQESQSEWVDYTCALLGRVEDLRRTDFADLHTNELLEQAGLSNPRQTDEGGCENGGTLSRHIIGESPFFGHEARAATSDARVCTLPLGGQMSRLVLVLPFLVGCACLPVPSVDSSPPTAGLRIEYRPFGGGARELKTFVPGDADVTIEASKEDVVTVLYTGGDAEGVRKVELEWDAAIVTDMSITSTLGTALFEESSCPRQSLLGSHNFDPSGTRWRYRFTTRSDNWLGTSARTPQITVMAK